MLFAEKQRFTQGWLIVLMALVVSGTSAITIYQMVTGKEVGNNPASTPSLIIGNLFLLGFVLFFFFWMNMKTEIKEDGIYVKFFPFHLKWRFYSWSELSKCYVRNYAPISEYGGWGIKGKMFKEDIAFNVSGKQGLQLEFVSGKKVLIGTQKKEEIKMVLIDLGQYKE